MKKFLTIFLSFVLILSSAFLPNNGIWAEEQYVDFSQHSTDYSSERIFKGEEYIFFLENITGFELDETKGVAIYNLANDSEDCHKEEYDENGNGIYAAFVDDGSNRSIKICAENNSQNGQYKIVVKDNNDSSIECYFVMFDGQPQDDQTLSKGIYFTMDLFGEPQTFNVLQHNQIIPDEEARVKMYYYDGNEFTEIYAHEIVSVDNNITIDTDHIRDDMKNIETDCIKLKSSIEGEHDIKYEIDGNEYICTFECTMPSFSLYKNNCVSKDSLIHDLGELSYPANVYLLARSDLQLISANFFIINGPEPQPLDSSYYEYNADTGVLTLKEQLNGSLKIKATISNGFNQFDMEICINSNFEQHNDELPCIEYQGKIIQFGCASISDSASLHITNGHGVNMLDEDFTHTVLLAAGIIQAATAEVAPEEIYSGIQKPTLNIIESTFNEGDISVNVGDDKVLNCERMMYPINFNIKGGAQGRAKIEIEFNVIYPDENNQGETKTEHIKTEVDIDCTEEIIETVQLSKEQMNVNSFNSIFSSFDNLCNAFPNEDLRNKNKIEIMLPDGEYSGNYEINIDDYNGPHVEGFKQFRILGSCNENNENQTTIKGELIIEGGFVNISNINFIGDSRYTSSITYIGLSNKKMGVVVKTSNSRIAGVYEISSSSFNNYDYAVVSTNNGVICDINSNVFEDCNYGYYMDCKGKDLNIGGDKSTNNIFRNIKIAAIYIGSTPKQLPAYSFRFKDNYFYNSLNSGYDIYLMQKDATLYFQQNYYGKQDYHNGESDLRTIRINTASGAMVISNPCIRYPLKTSGSILGIDGTPGLNLRIFSGVGMEIDARDVDKITKIGIGGTDGEKDLGSLEFTKEGE